MQLDKYIDKINLYNILFLFLQFRSLFLTRQLIETFKRKFSLEKIFNEFYSKKRKIIQNNACIQNNGSYIMKIL